MTEAKANRTGRAWKFGFVELILVALFAGVVGWLSRPSPIPPEMRELEDRYGPSRNSEHYEEWIVRDFFRDRREGFFVDVGANHYQAYSNTYYLETALGWSGIAVEPLKAFEAGYREHRPRTRFRAFFVSDISQQDAKMYLLADGNHLVTSSNKQFTERYGSNPQELTVPTITLNDLLDAEGVPAIDFLSMDIELHEPKALAGFDLQRFKPGLVCIEGHPEVRQFIIDYFTQRGYAVLGKYLRIDVHNLYFSPLRQPGQE